MVVATVVVVTVVVVGVVVTVVVVVVSTVVTAVVAVVVDTVVVATVVPRVVVSGKICAQSVLMLAFIRDNFRLGSLVMLFLHLVRPRNQTHRIRGTRCTHSTCIFSSIFGVPHSTLSCMLQPSQQQWCHWLKRITTVVYY